MRIVKVDAIASTNSYLKEYSRSTGLREDVLLWTEVQKKGRGQRNNYWESKPYQNLTFSIYKRASGFKASQQFYITMAASLAVFELLQGLGLKRLSVKWPNDIMAGSRKICGILIESVIKKSNLDAVIIGVGLNVNQTVFDHAPKATSVKLETGTTSEIKELLHMISPLLKKYVAFITAGEFDAIKTKYEELLFRRGVPSVFEDVSGHSFMAIIDGVSPQGLLLLKKEDHTAMAYDIKKVKLLY